MEIQLELIENLLKQRDYGQNCIREGDNHAAQAVYAASLSVDDGVLGASYEGRVQTSAGNDNTGENRRRPQDAWRPALKGDQNSFATRPELCEDSWN